MTSRFLKLTATAVAAALIAGTGLMPGAANAQAGKCPAPKGAVISKYGKYLDKSKLLEIVVDNRDELRKIPLIGKPIVEGFFKHLANLPYKTSKKFGKYLEYVDGNNVMTVFNVGDYAGSARWVISYAYDGTVTTPWNRGGKGSGVWKHLPGMKLHNPVIMYRIATGPASISTPVVPGGELKNLPGRLGKIADKAAKVTRTLRMPLGALLIAGWEPTGVSKDMFEILNLPAGKDKVYIMAGAGIESWPPGGSKIGKCNSDPAIASFNNIKTWGDGDPRNRNEEFQYPQKMLPAFNAYLKISMKGKWEDPMHLFDRKAYAEDAVIMIQPDGSLASWGRVRNFYKQDYTYAIDLPGLFDLEKAAKLTLPDIGIGLAVEKFDMADAVNLKVGIMTRFLDPGYIKLLAKAMGKTGIANDSAANSLFGVGYSVAEKVRDAVEKGAAKLPLDQVKIVNKPYQAWSKANPAKPGETQDYPPSDVFNIYFSAGNGITATGEKGPIFAQNGTFEAFGQELKSVRTVLSPDNGLTMDSSIGLDVSLGKVLSSELRIKGKDKTKVALTRKKQMFERSQDWNILGVAKGNATFGYYLDGARPMMHVKFDPTSGCAPPLPIKIDAKIGAPTKPLKFKSEIVGLFSSATFKSDGITNCAGKVIEWTKTGAKYVGKGVVIGGKYVAEGANYAAKYGKEGAKYTVKYAGVAGREATKGYNTAVNAVGQGAHKVANFAANAANTVKKFASNVGCALGIKCSSSKPPSPPKLKLLVRRASPFNCPQGYYYSAEFGQCWREGSAKYAYTGTPTDTGLCLTPGRIQNETDYPQTFLSKCSGSEAQQFLTAGQKGGKNFMLYEQDRGISGGVNCLTVPGGRFTPMTPLVNASGPVCNQAPAIKLDKLGRLVARKGNAELCVRPASPLAHRSAHGVLADWLSLDGRTTDVTIDQEGNVFVVTDVERKVRVPSATGWKEFVGSPAGFVRLDAGIINEVWAVRSDHAIFHFYGGWKRVKGGSTDIAAGGKDAGIVASLDTAYNSGKGGNRLWITKDKGKTWTLTKGHGVRVDVDGAGGIWLVQNNGHVWNLDPTHKTWTRMPDVPVAVARDISAGKTGTVMVTNALGEIYVLSGDRKKWQRFPGMGTNIAVGSDGVPVVGVDVGKHKGIVFIHTATTKSWGGILPPLDAFDVKHLDQMVLGKFAANTSVGGKVGAVPLVLDTCDPAPVTKTWTAIKPKHPGNFAKQAGMTVPFRLEHENFNGAYQAIGFKGLYKQGNRWQAIATPLRLNHRGRQALVAVFKDDARRFAMYNTTAGLCLKDQQGAPGPYNETRMAIFAPCTFADRQLWTRHKAKNKGRWLLHNEGTKRCLVPSTSKAGGFDGSGRVRLERWGVNTCSWQLAPGWIMAPYDAALKRRSERLIPLNRFQDQETVVLQVKFGGKCVDSTTSRNNGAITFTWDCDKTKSHQQFKVVPKGHNAFELRNQHTNKCLGVQKGHSHNGAPIDQWGCSGVAHQRWKVQDHGEGFFMLHNLNARGMCLSLARDKVIGNGEHLALRHCKNHAPQFFRIIN